MKLVGRSTSKYGCEMNEPSAQGSGELQGQVAVVTGAASGLGAAMAAKFASAGAAVAVLDIDGARAEGVAEDLAGLGVPTIARQIDVGDTLSIQAADAVAAELGGCDILCSNVGVQQFGAIDRLTEDEWSWVLNVNVMGTVRTVAAFLPLLRASSGWRRVTITSSSSAFVPGVRLGAYVASKCAVQGYADVLRMELAEEGIGVTVIVPAAMSSRHLESSAAARPAEISEWTLRPDDIEAMMASRSLDTATHMVSPEHAVRNLVADLRADQPYVITHGAYRSGWRDQVATIDAAFERMERS